jgi:hypothetical protein
MSPLNTGTGYDELLSYYEKNNGKPWRDWLSFDSIFEKLGKQGVVGLLNPSKLNGKGKYVFKMSQYINYLIHHEAAVMNGLNEISSYCPHFCRSYGIEICKIDPRAKKNKGCPFAEEGKVEHPIKKEVLLCEYVDRSCKFYNYIRAVERVDEDVLYAVIKQVLMALSIAQRKKQFAHYDLHSFNVMMRKCSKEAVFLYALDKENQFAIPTHGHYPIIIDFGFSYIKDMEDGPLWPSMGHTSVGFMSDRFDWVADPKLFLVTVSGEIKEKRNTKKAKKLRRVVRNLFGPLDIDWGSGWDEGDEESASDAVIRMLEGVAKGSTLFEDYDHYCMDILQTLVIIPMEKQNYDNIHKSYLSMIKEFIKIENQISSPFYNLYILKGVTDAARCVRALYVDKNTRIDAIRTFRHQIQEKVAEVAGFCRLDKVHFEKLLCSILVFSKCMEGVMYGHVEARMAEKQREYNKLPLQSVEQIYASIEANLPDEYVYSKNSTIYIVDSNNNECIEYKIPEIELKNVNQLHPMARGTYIYDLYNSEILKE